MKTKRQQLIDEPRDFTNEDDLLETFFSEHLNKFCLRLNGKLFTFKTWDGFVNKRNSLITKFNLS